MAEEDPRWQAIAPRSLLVDADRVVVRTAGRGPVLLLVHGMAGSATTWKHVLPTLAEHFTVVAPDLLGHGDSDKPRAEYSLGAHANTLRDVLDLLGHERATIVGQSLGGGVALQFAYQFPERCERLVLVSAGGLGREVSLVLRFLTLPGAASILRLAVAPGPRAVASVLGSALVRLGARATRAHEEMWRSYVSLAHGATRRAFFRGLHDVIDPHGQVVSASAHLADLGRIPTLIVWGASDPLIPLAHGQAGHRAIPGSRLVVLEGVGHFPHCEAPAEFVDAVLEFVATTTPARLDMRGRGGRDTVT